MIAVVNKVKENPKLWGIIACLSFSIILLLIFFGSILKNANSSYFSPSGDGLKSTFGSVYHLKYDTAFYRTQYMNYPFGESVFYTGGQPLIINIFKSIKNKGLDLSEYILGILNVWMLLSIVLAALFLYLIFRELKLPIIYALIVANIIAFMSPQIDRLGGHYNLAYIHFIPLIIYLFLRFYKSRNSYTSVFIGLTALYSLYTHIYFFGFFTFICLVFWFANILNESKNYGGIGFIIKHILIQFVFPLFIFQLLLWNADNVNDRTTYPWGFLELTSSLQDVFLPLHKSYGQFIGLNTGAWEGISYIGLVALASSIFLFIYFIRQALQKQLLRNYQEDKFLIILLFASIIALIFSFGLPFKYLFPELLNYTGLLKSFRAPGRYAWLFFYTINIITFYLIWIYYARKKSWISITILFLCLAWASYDAYLNVHHKNDALNHQIEALSDRDNKLALNDFMHQIDFDNYQAIISLPYFHIGSENYWIEGSDAIKKQSFIASMKTGLPLVSVMMGRTSMAQTIMNMQVFMEVYSEFEYLKHLKNKKAFLIIIDKNHPYNKPEQEFIDRSELLFSGHDFEYREISIHNIQSIVSDKIRAIRSEIDQFHQTATTLFSNDSSIKYFYRGTSFPNHISAEATKAKFEGDLCQNNLVLDARLTALTEDKHQLSFWIENMDKDMYPRTEIVIELFDENNSNYYWHGAQLWKHIKIIDKNGRGLFEIDLKDIKANSRIKIYLKNNLLTKGGFHLDELLIRPMNQNLYYKSEEFYYKNNRFYSLID